MIFNKIFILKIKYHHIRFINYQLLYYYGALSSKKRPVVITIYKIQYIFSILCCFLIFLELLYSTIMEAKALFGLNLKRLRKNNRLSQDQLSEKVNISVKHLSKIERGLTFVSADLLEKLSYSLNVSIAQLFCTENENIYDENVLKKFDRITEKHLIRAMEGIKGDIRKDDMDD